LIIVMGSYQVPPDQRDRFMRSKLDQTERTRTETGCLEYAFSADATDPGLVRLVELWESKADLEAHIAGVRSAPSEPPEVAVVSSTFAVFEGAPTPTPGG